MKSPIEMMVDEACGYGAQSGPHALHDFIFDDPLASKADLLLELADAATDWVESDAHLDRLREVAIKLIEAGW